MFVDDLFIFQLIDALESHVSTIRATLRRKLIKEGGHSGLIPRAASMAVEVSLFVYDYIMCILFGRVVFGSCSKLVTQNLKFQF